jgi:3-methyl-2-oxobutanoate hydroxymethyltransferase
MADPDIRGDSLMPNGPVRVPDFKNRKRRGEKIAMITAYDATMARLVDRAGVDAILVGDSVGMVVLGYESTVPVTLDEIVHHTRAVVRGTRHALVVADMPFLTYQVSPGEAVRNAGRLLQDGGAAAVKLEGGRPVVDVVKRLVDVGIPVMGHLGLQPQSIHQMGGFVRQARSREEADALIADALLLEEAGAFAIVLESVPSEVARATTASIEIPTIGIGAGPECDGQVLVGHDMLGLFDGFVPPFVKQYARLADTVVSATEQYVEDVRAGRYPQPTPQTTGTRTP